jgi:hypothetical protein
MAERVRREAEGEQPHPRNHPLPCTPPQKSPNLAFKWLQRRVGAQIGTCVYFATTNVMYAHDGRAWHKRDLDVIGGGVGGHAWGGVECE